MGCIKKSSIRPSTQRQKTIKQKMVSVRINRSIMEEQTLLEPKKKTKNTITHTMMANSNTVRSP